MEMKGVLAGTVGLDWELRLRVVPTATPKRGILEYTIQGQILPCSPTTNHSVSDIVGRRSSVSCYSISIDNTARVQPNRIQVLSLSAEVNAANAKTAAPSASR